MEPIFINPENLKTVEQYVSVLLSTVISCTSMIRQHQKAIDLGLFSDSEATRAAQIISALQVVNHLVIKMTEEISMRIDIDNDAVLADMAKSTEKAAKEFSKSRRAKK